MKDKYLVIGDGICGPFMATCLRLNNIDCDLIMSNAVSQQDRSVIVLTPASTQLLGDVLDMSVPRGSVVSRLLSFDHAGNDLCDVDLNKFRLDGVSPTFYACERLRVQESLYSLCRTGRLACKILPENTLIDTKAIKVNADGTVCVSFTNMPYLPSDYTKIIYATRNHDSVPVSQAGPGEKTNHAVISAAPRQRWLEASVPALPETDEGKFVPGSQEVVEIITNATSKLIVKPTLIGSKLFYNVLFSMRAGAKDPGARGYDPRRYWNEFAMLWSSGKPEYIHHTLFKPLMAQVQHKSDHRKLLIYKTSNFVLPEWVTHSGAVLRVGPSAYSTHADTIDVLDGNSFMDCYLLAKQLGEDKSKAVEWLQKTRREEVITSLQNHKMLTDFTFHERSQWGFICSRFRMKFLGRYRKTWGTVLKPMISVL